MHLSSLIRFVILSIAIRQINCKDNGEWYFDLGTAFKNCPTTPWNSLKQDDFLESFRRCVQRKALNFLDSVLEDDVIPIIDGVDLIRFEDENSTSFVDNTTRKASNETDDNSNWTKIILKRLTHVLRTHVLKIDVDHLINNLSSSTDTSDIYNSSNTIEGRRRRHRRRHHVMPFMMMGLLIMGSVLIPMGFQFLAVLGGKALILAKMALLLSSIQGLKKIATNGVNYGLYHAPIAETGWHERSQPEPSTQFDLPYPMHTQSYSRV